MNPPVLTHEQYVRQVGAPRVVTCDIDLPGHGYVYWCRTHEYGFYSEQRTGLARDRCPMSRLEEWRQRRWELMA